MKLDTDKIAESRNFANKLWNIARFILAQGPPQYSSSEARSSRPEASNDTVLDSLDPTTLTTLDRAILHKLRATWLEVERVFYDGDDYAKEGELPADTPPRDRPRSYDLAHAGVTLYNFVWSEFADWYVEAAKVQLKNEERTGNTKIILNHLLENSLKMLHPFMPFITEAVWTHGIGKKEMLIVSDWPELGAHLDQPEDAERYDLLKGIVEAIRRIRADNRTPAAAWIQAHLQTDEPRWILESADVINQLARLKILRVSDTPFTEQESATAVVGPVTISLPLANLVDEKADTKRLQQEIEQAKMEVERLERRLANKEYVAKAPPAVVAQTEVKLAESEARLKKLEASQRQR